MSDPTVIKKPKISDFDDVLDYVGGWGRYQKLLLVGSFMFTVILAYVQLTAILFLYTPEHICRPRPEEGGDGGGSVTYTGPTAPYASSNNSVRLEQCHMALGEVRYI